MYTPLPIEHLINYSNKRESIHMNTFKIDTVEELKLEFWQLENEANVRKEAQDKVRKEQEDLITSGKLGESAASSSVITSAVESVIEGLKDYISATISKPVRGQPSRSVIACKVLSEFDEQALNNIAADSISLCLNGVGVASENSLIHSLGDHVEHEFMLRSYREQDNKAAKYLKDYLTASASTIKERYNAVEYSLSANRLEWTPWLSRDVILIGQILFQQVINNAGIFDLQTVVEVF